MPSEGFGRIAFWGILQNFAFVRSVGPSFPTACCVASGNVNTGAATGGSTDSNAWWIVLIVAVIIILIIIVIVVVLFVWYCKRDQR